ncbi:MAG TPA: P-loop NTPase [Candidatus Anaerotruncus excrementipullorum]|uniref:P-loop NTPase n=1 Tax=Candidatus Anaerotruncus excrementipullorum TaxID=2838465 RepID=A0A9D1WPS1_9FIRM|nr:P-loop NTPase [Candidatus Anaerotruncus excrementipullorum]
MSQCILVTSGRGGLGKSVVVAGLARALALQGQRVALVEGTHRSLDLLFGVSQRAVFDWVDLVEGRCSLADALLPLEGALDGEPGPTPALLCGPSYGVPLPPAPPLGELCARLEELYDLVLVEAGDQPAGLLRQWARAASRGVVVATPDPVAVRAGREVSDLLDEEGVPQVQLCVNMLPADFLKTRPVPDLDWMIDQVCAQLIAVVPWERVLSGPLEIGKKLRLSNVTKIIFDNFAQRILGNYIDLWIQ